MDGPIVYKEATDEQSLADFEDLIAQYWDLPDETRPYVDGCIRRAFEFGDRGVWLLAYKSQEPVGKAYLSLQGADDTASIWGVYVKSTARGYGIGTRLTELALERAAALGKSRVVLGSSEMGLNVYRRIGFKETRALAVYASASFPRRCKAPSLVEALGARSISAALSQDDPYQPLVPGFARFGALTSARTGATI